MAGKIPDLPELGGTVSTASPVPTDYNSTVDRLESWKQIAEFIGRDERTAMRWAKELGMPIQRIGASKRSRIYASRRDISAWLANQRNETKPVVPAESQPVPSGRHRSRTWVIGGLVMVCFASAWIVWQIVGATSDDLLQSGRPESRPGEFYRNGN